MSAPLNLSGLARSQRRYPAAVVARSGASVDVRHVVAPCTRRENPPAKPSPIRASSQRTILGVSRRTLGWQRRGKLGSRPRVPSDAWRSRARQRARRRHHEALWPVNAPGARWLDPRGDLASCAIQPARGRCLIQPAAGGVPGRPSCGRGDLTARKSTTKCVKFSLRNAACSRRRWRQISSRMSAAAGTRHRPALDCAVQGETWQTQRIWISPGALVSCFEQCRFHIAWSAMSI